MKEIENTGERILLEKESPLMIARHFSAYKFAKGLVAGKRVLEIGSGEGYGTHYLSGFAKNITGIDYSKDAVQYAKDKYKNNNLSFLVMDAKEIGKLNEKFDIVCSFQNIEHIEDTDSLLKNVAQILDENGIFICSTCNKKDASPNQETPLNKFHVKEYLWLEFMGLLTKYFKSVEMAGLKRSKKMVFYRRLKKIGIFNFLPEKINPVKRFYARISHNDFVITNKNLDRCLDFIAVCRK